MEQKELYYFINRDDFQEFGDSRKKEKILQEHLFQVLALTVKK